MRRPRFPPVSFIAVGILFFATVAAAQISKEREIDETAMAKADYCLFALGNSYTFYWDVPGLVQKFATEPPLNKTLFTHRMAWGGQSLATYVNLLEPAKGEPMNAEVANLLDPRWDAILLQPWKGDQGVEEDLRTNAPKIIAEIRQKNPRAKILLYLWDDGPDPTARQRAFEEVAKQSDALIVPAGWAWAQGRKEKPEWVWNAPDGWHPGYRRAYITASAVYATLFQTRPIGLKLRSWEHWVQDGGKIDLTDEEATYLQTIAWDAVRQHTNIPVLRTSR